MKIRVPEHSDQPVDDATRAQLIDRSRFYLGVPWRHMGRTAQGLDCAGLIIITMYDVLGVWVEVSDYQTWPNPQLMRQICNQALLRGDMNDPKVGDVLLLYAAGYGVVHMGWFTGNTLIHAVNDPGVRRVVEVPVPNEKIYGVFRVPRYEA